MNHKAEEQLNKFLKFGSHLGLERMNELLKRLGHPEENLKVIHVAGTNGKGSICHFLDSVLRCAGYRTGLFTSPYLEVFNERIRIDGENISESLLSKCTDKAIAAAELMVKDGLDSPTEFEMVTAIAFLAFKEEKLDLIILEVGLGGRGDSTNVISKPLLTIIGSISMDHCDRLGDTIEKIAYEKAGIIKEGTPLIAGVASDLALGVIKSEAERLNAPVIEASYDEIIDSKIHPQGGIYTFINGGELLTFEISMSGIHQGFNSLIAIKAIDYLKSIGIEISDKALKNGLLNAKNPGRMEMVLKNPIVILDGAHNADGIKKLEEFIERVYSDKPIISLVGILADKDVNAIGERIIHFSDHIIVTEPDNPRKMPANELTAKLKQYGNKSIKINCEQNAQKALAMAIEEANARNAIVICCGSLYLIGRLRRLISEKKDNTIL